MLDKLSMQINRGAKAKNALQNEIISQAFAEVEKEIIEGWKECSPFDPDLQATLKMNHEALKQVKQKLALYISKGEVATAQRK